MNTVKPHCSFLHNLHCNPCNCLDSEEDRMEEDVVGCKRVNSKVVSEHMVRSKTKSQSNETKPLTGLAFPFHALLCCTPGLTKLVDQTKAFDLHNEAGLTALSRLIRGLHKLIQHPHNQVCLLYSKPSIHANGCACSTQTLTYTQSSVLAVVRILNPHNQVCFWVDHSALCTLHSALCTLHSALCTLHSALCTLCLNLSNMLSPSNML